MLNPSRHLALEGSLNTRELGGYATAAGPTTQWQRLLRSDNLHQLTETDQQALLDYGVRTLIDLRGADELHEAPNVFAQHPRVSYHNIPLFAPLMRNNGLGAGSSANFDLGTLYRLALDHCQETIAKVLELLAQADDGVSLFHCTAGKDRTGIIAALLLSLAEVDEPTIVEDYALTAQHIEPMLAQLRMRALKQGHDVERYNRMLLAEPPAMESMLKYLEGKYGGVEPYLNILGLNPTIQNRLKSLLSN